MLILGIELLDRMAGIVRLGAGQAVIIIRVDEEGICIGLILEDVVRAAAEEYSAAVLFRDLEDDLGLLDVHAVVLRHALIGIVAEVAKAVVRRIVRALNEIVEVRLIAELLGSHGYDLAVIAAHPHLLRHEVCDLTAAAAVLARDRDKSVLFHKFPLLPECKEFQI